MVLDNVLNKMLPKQLQNLDEELSVEDIKTSIVTRITRYQQDLLGKRHGNITLNNGLINRQASFLFQIQSYERTKQLQQRELVSDL